MKIKHVILLFIIFVNTYDLVAQYVVKSNNILNPDLNIDYVKSNADFWIKNAYDPVYGGFFSNVDRVGNVISHTDVHTNIAYKRKSLISQTRHGYGMTRAFMLTGDETYLNYAKSALDFLFNYGWDKTYDGWFCFAKQNGTIDHGQWWDPDANTKWGFQQHYALVGVIANFEATQNDVVKTWMDKGINTLYNKMWDSRPGYEGYYSDADLNWSNKRNKGFTTTIDAITTNAELTYLILQQQVYKNRLLDLGNIAVNRLVNDMDNPLSAVYFHENFTTDWLVDYSANEVSIGHAIKTAWCLGRAYLCDTTQKELKAGARKILDETWNFKNGSATTWDHINGGPFTSIRVNTADGVNTTKDYWTVEQGFTGPMINYYITKDPVYLQMADESMSFFMNFMVDKQYGEIFSTTDAAGALLNGNKGDDFKASYHSIEMGYFGYLYSKLYYLNESASLYYKFESKPEARQIKLTPIPIEETKLKIKEVTLDGIAYADFDANARILNIPANIGGKFKVTYEYVSDNLNALNQINNSSVSLYPNPVKDQLTITGLENTETVMVTDLTGKVLSKLCVNNQNTVSFDVNSLKQGVYFVVLQSFEGIKTSRRFIRE